MHVKIRRCQRLILQTLNSDLTRLFAAVVCWSAARTCRDDAQALGDHLSRLRNPSSNRRAEEDPLCNVSTGGAAADATVGSQILPSRKHAAPVIHTDAPESPTTTLLTEAPLLLPNPSSEVIETENLLVDNIDLWDEAYKNLKCGQPKLFERYKRCIITSSDESAAQPILDLDNFDSDQRESHLANQIEKRLNTIQEQEWSTAGDVYKKIVRTVLFAKDFMGQAVSNEPHAALAWAGVSMLLPVSGPQKRCGF